MAEQSDDYRNPKIHEGTPSDKLSYYTLLLLYVFQLLFSIHSLHYIFIVNFHMSSGTYPGRIKVVIFTPKHHIIGKMTPSFIL